MSRWHEPSCREPDVAVDAAARISCRACGAVPNLQELISEQAVDSHFPSIPPDEPAGRLNLSWPPCVPYRKIPDEAAGDDEYHECGRNHDHAHAYVFHSAPVSPNPEKGSFSSTGDGKPKTLTRRRTRQEVRNSKKRRATGLEGVVARSLVPLKRASSPALTEETLVTDANLLPVYGEALGQNEFRLVCVDAAEHTGREHSRAGQHIHLSLETYTHDSCPEYEAVSYTWAGEDGDQSWSCPVYVGPYWDVLLVTKNCEAMIRFLRPRRGLRLLWIDVVCINQGNVDEREGQVAKMGRIYEESSGVVVYLGNDLVLNAPDRYPPRHRLHKLDTMLLEVPIPGGNDTEQTRITLRQLLGRRYFSRVWVIQELILAPRVSIPVGDVVFLADSLLSKYLKLERAASGWSWDETPAPWVQYVAQGAFPVRKVSDLMGLTLSSLASDPRDKVFGVLGLYQDGSEKCTLRPDYSISCQHVFMGFFAYCVITLQELHLLCNAAGIAEAGSYPSWMPDWKSPDSWKRAFRRLQEAEMDCDRITASIQSSPPPPHGLDESLRPSLDGVFPGTPQFFRLGTENEKSEASPKRGFPTDMSIDVSVDLDDSTVFELRPWHKDIRVDRDTGGLSINLTRLMSVKRSPIFVKNTGALGIYELLPEHDDDPIYQDLSMYIGSPLALDTVIRPGLDDIFILNPGDAPLLFLVLRKTETRRTFRLVAPCPYLSVQGTLRESFLLSNPLGTPPPARFQSLKRLQSSRYTEIKRLRRLLSHRIDDYFGGTTPGPAAETAAPVVPYGAERVDNFKRRTAQAFPGLAGSPKWALLRVYLSHIRQEKSGQPGFEAAYTGVLDQTFCAQVADGFVQLRFDSCDWLVAQANYQHGGMAWEWYDGEPVDGAKWRPVSEQAQDSGAAIEWAMSFEVSQTQQSMDLSFVSQEGSGQAWVWVRCPLTAVQSLVRDHAWDLGLYGTAYASLQLDRDDAEARLWAGPHEEDRFVANESGTGVFDLDGSTFQVHIL